MKERLNKALMDLEPIFIEIIDDSESHRGHAGHNGSGESHFNIKIVSSAFNGKSMVDRHRMVNSLIKHEFTSTLHALSMKLISAEEFK